MKIYPSEIRQVNGWYAISAEQIAVRGIFDPAVDSHSTNNRGFGGRLLQGLITRSFTPNLSTTPANAIYVDFAGSDAYAQEVQKTLKRAEKAVASAPKIAELQKKPFWTRGDRLVYESTLAQIVSEELAKSPLLSEYRDVKLKNPKEPENLNATTPASVFNCRGMAITEAFLLQSLEDQLLPFPSGREGVWKERGAYYVATGTMVDGAPASGHMFVIAPTGNIIEPTDTFKKESWPYRHVLTPEHSFERAIAGYPLATQKRRVTEEGYVQSLENDTVRLYTQDKDPRDNQASRALYRQREALAHKGDWDALEKTASGGTQFWKEEATNNRASLLQARISAECNLDSLDDNCLKALKDVTYMPASETQTPGVHGLNRSLKGDALKPAASASTQKPETTRSF